MSADLNTLAAAAENLLSQALLLEEVKNTHAPGDLRHGTLTTWGDLAHAREIIDNIMDQIEPANTSISAPWPPHGLSPDHAEMMRKLGLL
jgi:hypothetical protein